jgi:hypothetical protein
MARYLVVAGERGSIAVVEQDEVDIARVVEFVRAELAHAQHRECRGLGIAVDRELAVARELQEDRVGQRIEAAGGEGAECAGDLLQRPDARDVGDGDGERLLAFEPAQGGGDRVGFRAIASHGAGCGEFGIEARHDDVGTGAP